MALEIDDIVALKARWAEVQKELVKYEERRMVARANLKKAREGLADLGIDPDDAAEEVERLARSLDQRLGDLEVALGIK